jgi:hypothetical protein
MSNPADYFMSLMSLENPNEIENEPGKPPKTEAELVRNYNSKISYLLE